MKFKFKAIWSEEDQEYVGLCDQFPGLSWLAKTEREALEGIKKVVSDCLKGVNKMTAEYIEDIENGN